ncbi:FeoA family protein [Flavobacterium sp. JP2137]|uniref:FeoA family protein n=1 Tax=Flavobacterium sp. JP2137 TaxID=3414510 RepID=UPI003D2FF51D
MNLSELKKGEKARVIGISQGCTAEVHQRFLDLGFVKGVAIEIQNISPLRDPVAYNIHNTLISLRLDDAKMIAIEKIEHEES